MDASVFQLPWRDALSGMALLFRSSGFVIAAPVLGTESLPNTVKGGLAVLLILLVAPVVPAPPLSSNVLFLAATETFIGLTLGFIGRLVLEILTYAGVAAGFPTGLAMAAILDPVNQTQTTPLGIFYQVVGVTAFLMIGGLNQVVAVFVRSYEVLPVGMAHFNGSWLASTVTISGQVLSLGLRLAAPILAAGLLVDVFLMLVARAVPQMNLLVVGAPVRLMAGLLALAFSLQVFLPIVGEALETSTRAAGVFLHALGGRG